MSRATIESHRRFPIYGHGVTDVRAIPRIDAKREAFEAGYRAASEAVLRYFAGTKALYGTDWIAKGCIEFDISHDFGGGSAPITERTDVQP